ncbi:MAG: hypothetical protein LUC44_01060 [Prevotellaceae bacterium]|nr:hypothetical protein [Prevotellaceae bacterium]
MRRVALACCTTLLLTISLTVQAQTLTAEESAVRKSIESYFTYYRRSTFTSDDPIRANSIDIDDEERSIRVNANEGFAVQPFTKEIVELIYKEIADLLPSPYNTYQISVSAGGAPIEELVPQEWNDNSLPARHWEQTEYRGNAWTERMERAYDTEMGLKDRHVTLWASHGKYYDLATGLWKWQRPRLFCTTEDLFTQSMVVPFLMPMLENAGAVVFSPRERDWQRNEVIVDNDQRDGTYRETDGTRAWRGLEGGFGAKECNIYLDRENPFELGTSRCADTQPPGRQPSQIVWQPNIPEDGDYAVYVSYQTQPNSVSDAVYTVRHRGVETHVRVNQQMGGGTWVYLGTYDFKAGFSEENRVELTNESNYRGVVTADAVRFGGGMGNIARGDETHAALRSGLPRYLEGSRYTAQWGGMPYHVYGTKESENDYGEDINARSLMSNLLTRGSVYLPGDSGRSVPIELSLAIHSDAGYHMDNSRIGTLGIYTTGNYTPTEYEDGWLAEGLFPSGLSRMASRDLCDRIISTIAADMQDLPGSWTRRQMHDKNYSETREPLVPSAIIETLSHQNWGDLIYGHDPWFKFLISRSIYKGVLKFVSAMHGRERYVVQPLPVTSTSAMLNESGDSVTLSWQPVADPKEPTALPTHYVVYTARGERGYDNGTRIYGTSVRLPITKGELTRYRVTAANDGGQSMESEELCVYRAAQAGGKRLLIVNGFHRLAGPQPVNTGSLLGFDMDTDPGVVYRHCPCYCGRQTDFDTGKRSTLGASGEEYEGLLVAGNTFDYPTLHSEDILAGRTDLSISSCSAEALASGQAGTGGIDMIDYILGAQRNDGYSLTSKACFDTATCQRLEDFTGQGGALLMSGAYISEELNTGWLLSFANRVLHVAPQGIYPLGSGDVAAEGMGTSFGIWHEPNEKSYAVRRCSVLNPTEGSFCTMLYAETRQSAGVACETGSGRTLTFGFPLETIDNQETRRAIIGASIKYLLYTR